MDSDGTPPPRCGNVFVGIHGGRERPGPSNKRNRDVYYDFSVTLTMRLGKVSLDRVGDQLIARNIRRVPEANRDGFNAKMDQLASLLHMNWRVCVLPGQTPPSANDNLVAWSNGALVYGFVEPVECRGPAGPAQLVGGEWFGAEPDAEDFGLKAEMRFEGARRMQPQTAAVGSFV